MPSIVDPVEARGGAWTLTRGLIKAIDLAWPGSRVECIPLSSRSPASHRLRQLTSLISSALGSELPAKVAFTRTRRMRRQVRAAVAKGKPDLIIINGTDLLWTLSECGSDVPVVAIVHNIESELYLRQISHVANPRSLMGRLLAKDYRKLRAYEWAGMCKAGRAIFLSEEDKQAAVDVCPGIVAVVVPPIFDYEPASRDRSATGRLSLGMFADFTWWPNRVSLEWFLSQIWPSISDNVELHLMGYGSQRVGTGVERVTSHGFVRDPRIVFARCDVMIAPIIEGAGVKMKVAEALFNRVPVAATSFSVRGLPARAIHSVHVCDSSAEWVAFLNGDAALEFSRRPVPVDAAACFSTQKATDALRSFIHNDLVRL